MGDTQDVTATPKEDAPVELSESAPGLSPAEKRYLVLLEQALERLYPGTAEIVDTMYRPRGMSIDSLAHVKQRHNELIQLRKDLVQADATHAQLLASLRERPPVPPASPDPLTRVTDFMWGLIASVERDFSKSADLQLLAQELYAAQRSGEK